MKAVTLKQAGGIENLNLEEVPVPQIRVNEVLIKVKAISINPVDAFARSNQDALLEFVKPSDTDDKLILGWDISGTITEIGSAASRFKKGDEVFGMVNFAGHGKAYAEYVAAPEIEVALKPENISHSEAAAAGLAALTAWQALVTSARIKKGDKVLIHRASGGVGHYAVQMAKNAGAYVIGTGSATKKEFILSLGADEFIDHTAEKFEDKIQDADIVLDSVYGDHLLRSLDSVKHGGRVISLLTYFEGEIAKKAETKQIFAKRISVTPDPNDLESVRKLLSEGKIHSHISQTFNFKDIPKAHQQIETGKTVGKIVVMI